MYGGVAIFRKSDSSAKTLIARTCLKCRRTIECLPDLKSTKDLSHFQIPKAFVKAHVLEFGVWGH